MKGRKSAADVRDLGTEKANRTSRDLDRKSALQIANIIWAEDAKVASAVKRALPQIGEAIDMVAAALRAGGRLIYVGAGTSGRLAALDAAECPPTFNTRPQAVQFVMAGGAKALAAAVEANEDSRELGRREIKKKKPGKNDVVVGIAASGRTPFTVAAVEYARQRGAKTIALACNKNSPLQRTTDMAIIVEVGAEVVAGSSRMKAGTSQKIVLNMLSTGAMARLGYVYGNLMVYLHVKNSKLADRGLGILERAAGVNRSKAMRALKAANDSVPEALVMLEAGVNHEEAKRALHSTQGHVRKAIAVASRKK